MPLKLVRITLDNDGGIRRFGDDLMRQDGEIVMIVAGIAIEQPVHLSNAVTIKIKAHKHLKHLDKLHRLGADRVDVHPVITEPAVILRVIELIIDREHGHLALVIAHANQVRAGHQHPLAYQLGLLDVLGARVDEEALTLDGLELGCDVGGDALQCEAVHHRLGVHHQHFRIIDGL